MLKSELAYCWLAGFYLCRALYNALKVEIHGGPFPLVTIIPAFQLCGKKERTDVGFVSGPPNDSEDNPVGRWPWMASLGDFDAKNKWKHKCGATLISSEDVIKLFLEEI